MLDLKLKPSTAPSAWENIPVLFGLRALAAGEEVNWAEIAEEYGLTKNAIYQRLARAKKTKTLAVPVEFLTGQPSECDCDEHGPCSPAHMKNWRPQKTT